MEIIILIQVNTVFIISLNKESIFMYNENRT